MDKSAMWVIGDVMLDHYVDGVVERLSPEAPVPVFKPSRDTFRLGGAANVAINLASFDYEVSMFGLVGSDNCADTVFKLFDEATIFNKTIKEKGAKTIVKKRYIANGQQILRVDQDYDYQRFSSGLMSEILNNYNGERVIVSDYLKGTITEIDHLISKAHLFGSIVIVDPKGADWSKYCGADILTPNRNELRLATGCSRENEILAAQIACEKYNFRFLVLTRSEDGICVVNRDGLVYETSSTAEKVFDVTGAGDIVVSCLAYKLEDDLSNIVEATKYANMAASYSVGKLGTVQDIGQSFKSSAKEKMLSINDMKKILCRMPNHKFVFTNGCFDILHVGHVNYLEKAKLKGDFLVVSINSDNSVKKIKGNDRPIHDLDFRKKQVASLSCVDFVISFTEETPRDLYKELDIKYLAKGADYDLDSIVGREVVEKNGGEVYRIELEQGFSSSELIENIKDKL